jgi:hypothetical protein
MISMKVKGMKRDSGSACCLSCAMHGKEQDKNEGKIMRTIIRE